jgi:hypothetical protein
MTKNTTFLFFTQASNFVLMKLGEWICMGSASYKGLIRALLNRVDGLLDTRPCLYY